MAITTGAELCRFHQTSWLRLQSRRCIDCGGGVVFGAYCSRCRASRSWHHMADDPIVRAYRLWRKALWQRKARAS
jgi:hypothetical protein